MSDETAAEPQAVTLFGLPQLTSPTECTVAVAVSWLVCRDLIWRWHRTLPKIPQRYKVAFIAYAPNGEPVSCATWGHPVARKEDQKTTLELTRMANAAIVPKNFSTWMLGQMRRWIRANMPEIQRLISYQDPTTHQGTIYKADNWHMAGTTRPSYWHTREGRQTAPRSRKIKWERKP